MDVSRDIYKPNGQLRQMEYAMAATKSGCSVIGICTKNCVILTAQKRILIWMVSTNVENIVKVDTHIGCGMSGLMADGRRLIDQARAQCQKHWFNYDESMSVESCVGFTSTLIMKPSDPNKNYFDTICRPYGVSLLFAGFDGDKPQLWHMDPTRTYCQHSVKAMGSGSEVAQQYLEQKYRPEMDLKDAIELSLVTIQQVMQEKVRTNNIEVMFMTKGQKEYTKLTEDDLKEILNRLE